MRAKIFFLNLLTLIAFLFLAVRLVQLQLFEGEKYRQLAEGNRIRKIKIVGPRGIIFDRHGEILAKNTVVYKITEGSREVSIGREEALKMQAEGEPANLYLDFIRDYPQGGTFGHITGYLGEVNEEEIKKGKLKIGDLVGRMGVEEYYEKQLRGLDGGELVEVDTQGKVGRRIGRIEPVSGKNLTLAIDAGLQKVAARELAGRKGVVVVTNAETGEVLVLYSSPAFDPNYFVGKRSETLIQNLITDKVNQPLLNRIISGVYPPGSTFKIVTAAAGLEEKKITRNTLIDDPGVIQVGDYKYANWYFSGYGKTEGEINIVRAITRSTDTFFYQLGEMVGVERLVFWAEKFGLDKVFGLDLNGEAAGFIPTSAWKEKIRGEPWFLGNTYHFAIGQGDLALTPLGVNLMTAAIANNGKICRPRMLKIEPGEEIDSCREVGLKKETVAIIKEGMIGACLTGGTAWPLFNFKPEGLPAGGQFACKTGTAEYVEDGKTKTHAWFTAFTVSPARSAAPDGSNMKFNKPSVVVTVLIEGGGEGSSVAAPIAKEILTEFFKVR